LNLFSAIDGAIDFIERDLGGRDEVGDSVGGCSDPSSRGAEVGAGPRSDPSDEPEDSDDADRESRTGEGRKAGVGEGRSLVLLRFEADMSGLWTAEGFGLP